MKEDLVKKRMGEVVDLVASDVAAIRTGRASSALLEDLEVSVYGGQQKLKINELATINTPDTQTLIIEPWDKSIIGEIKKGIQAANVGLSPAIDGEIVRITFTPPTTEDRERYIKLLGTKIESGKIMLRQIRGEFMKEIREAYSDKEITEDEKFNQEKQLQDITDNFSEKIEDIGERKEQELLGL